MNDEETYEHWLETGEYADGIHNAMLVIEVKEDENGILDDTFSFILHGSTDLTQINGKRVRKAADAARKAFSESLFDNLEKP